MKCYRYIGDKIPLISKGSLWINLIDPLQDQIEIISYPDVDLHMSVCISMEELSENFLEISFLEMIEDKEHYNIYTFPF